MNNMNKDILTINSAALVDAIKNGATKEQILKSIAAKVDEALEDNSKKTKLMEARKAAKTALVAYVCELINVDPDHIDDATFSSIDLSLTNLRRHLRLVRKRIIASCKIS